ncbi:hypothetical protein OROMI_002479 [Orobanche minor]
MPPPYSAPAPKTRTGQPSFTWLSPSKAPTNTFFPPPAPIWSFVPTMPPVPSLMLATSAPFLSPPSSSPIDSAPLSAIAPVSYARAPWGVSEPPPPDSVLPEEPPSLPHDVPTSPAVPSNPPPVRQILSEPPSNPPEQNVYPIIAPSPSIDKITATIPVTAPSNKISHHYDPRKYSPIDAPTARNPLGHSNIAPPPHLFSKSKESHSPRDGHHAKVNNSTRAPGSSASPSSIHSKSPPFDNKYAPTPAPTPTPTSSSWQAKLSPSRPSPSTHKVPLMLPMQALSPPPPRKDCAPLICTEPYTYGPPESPCACVQPIQVGIRLTVALYTFFPLVSELASEIATGVFMKQSQVRVVGANAAEDSPDKTIVLIDLLPLGEKFDYTTANFTFQRFWQKQVAINASYFDDYFVLYVRYPGLPPSPPLPPSAIGVVASIPYPGRNNPKSMKPFGVDVSGKQQTHGLSGSIVATIVLSCFAALVLFCAVVWVFLFRYRQFVFQPNQNPPTTIPSLTKSSGLPVSTVRSGTSSPSFSLGSSIAAYTGSAKTFSSSDIEKATDFFNETRILGEGGFGRVYSGVLEDGTKVAVKILKRYDQQGSREFLAEVEMLSRLHHRNLVKLIGICVEDRTRCLVYELIPNGCDKERSPLDWSARLKIALGAARALAYLHEDSSPRVIHRDFKASNILLEDDFTPKVSDFGLARTALDEENRHISTRVMGTFGYVAPEYAMTGHLLVKSDVYSYGVVLLELLTGRKPVDMSQPPGQENLVSWARPLLTSNEGLESVIDQSLAPDLFFLDSVSKASAIASICVQPEVSHRPFMSEVVQALKLVCDECDEIKELPSKSSSQEDLSIAMEVKYNTNSDRLMAPLVSPSAFSDYEEYRVDVERDLSMSELLSPEGKFGVQDSKSFRRHSSSGPLIRTDKGTPVWKKMRRLSRGSVSEHGVLFKLRPGSH